MLHRTPRSRSLSHPCGVSLQDQLLGSPHLLLLHLSADGLFGLICQLTAGRQAGIPRHFLNTPTNTYICQRQTIFNIYCMERQEACWEDGGGMMFWAEKNPSATAWPAASKSWCILHWLTEAPVTLNNLTQQAARGGQQNTSTESFQSWCKSSCFQK